MASAQRGAAPERSRVGIHCGLRWMSASRPAARDVKSVKRADRPDSVRGAPLATRARDRHSSGPGIAARLGATYPPARAEPHFEADADAPPAPAYLVLLRVEIARFTRRRALRRRPTRLCCSDPHLAVDSR